MTSASRRLFPSSRSCSRFRAAALAQAKLKVYISADMEGIAGVVTGEQLGPPGFEYERFRGFMTNEVLAAIEGARAAGATEILVSDSHGNGQNLLIERFPKDVQIVRAWPRPLAMMQGIDASFDAVLFVGFHYLDDVHRGRARAHDVLGQPRRRAPQRRLGARGRPRRRDRRPLPRAGRDDLGRRRGGEGGPGAARPDRGRRREVELRLPLGAHADARGELRADPRGGEDGASAACRR